MLSNRLRKKIWELSWCIGELNPDPASADEGALTNVPKAVRAILCEPDFGDAPYLERIEVCYMMIDALLYTADLEKMNKQKEANASAFGNAIKRANRLLKITDDEWNKWCELDKAVRDAKCKSEFV